MSSSYEYNKKYSQKWNKEHIKKATVSLSIEQHKKLSQYCEEHNIGISTLIKERLKDILD